MAATKGAQEWRKTGSAFYVEIEPAFANASESPACYPVGLISEASSGDPFAFSTLRQPRCMKWMVLIGLMVTL